MTHLNQLRFTTLLVGLLVLLLVVGCAAGGDVEPTAAAATAGNQEATPVLDRVEADAGEESEADTSAPATEEEDMVESGDDDQGVIGEAATDDSQAGEGAVSPVEVDIGKITPEPVGEEGEPVEMPQPGVPDPGKAMAHKSAQNLAQMLGVDVGEIAVISQEEVQWRDSSLGCPKPGMSYLMVITPGFRIELEAEGETYLYHTDSSQRVVLCDPENAQPKYGPPDQ